MKREAHVLCGAAAIILFITFTASVLQAASIKERMRQRLPIIVSLKAKGVVGENNRGYLEFKGPVDKADIVKAENNDRRIVYQAIAKQQKTSAEIVGKRRARQIAATAPPGTLVQDESGKWLKR